MFYFSFSAYDNNKYYIFTVSRGPFIEEFYQCVTYGSYSAPWQEQLYTMFTLVFMFIVPLSILLLTYVNTIKTIAGEYKTHCNWTNKQVDDICNQIESDRALHGITNELPSAKVSNPLLYNCCSTLIKNIKMI